MRKPILLSTLTVCLAVFSTAVWAHPPEAGPLALFADGIAGPEGLAFTRHGELAVGTGTGDILLFDREGGATLMANVGDPLVGISVLRDGRILAASFGAGRVWAIEPDGTSHVLASGIGGANFIAETRNGRVLVSASLTGQILDITHGTPVEFASGFMFPNGLALGRSGGRRFLYVAETLANRVSRLPLAGDDTPGSAELYATGLPLADGLAFDVAGNLWVVGGGTLKVIVAKTGELRDLSSAPLLNWPSNLAFGRGHGFKRRDVYLANFGPLLGDGTTLVRFSTNHSGARLRR